MSLTDKGLEVHVLHSLIAADGGCAGSAATAGIEARADGMAELPFDIAVEIELVARIR